MEGSNKIKSKSDFVRNVKDNFLQKFKGKTNFVTKEGLIVVLFKPEE